MLERLRGWRTVLWNLFLAIAPVLIVALDRFDAIDLSKYLNEFDAIIVGLIVGAVGIWLRYLTTGPIGEP